MKNWKTTTFGLIGAIGAAIVAAIRTGLIDGSHLPDWVNGVAGLCSVIGSVGLGFFAHDSAPVPPAPGVAPSDSEASPPSSSKLPFILFCILLFLFCLLFSGCAFSRPHLREQVRETNGVVTVRDMWLTGYAIWPATQNIERQKAILGKTFSVGTFALEQQTGGTNVVEALRYIDSIIGRLSPK